MDDVGTPTEPGTAPPSPPPENQGPAEPSQPAQAPSQPAPEPMQPAPEPMPPPMQPQPKTRMAMPKIPIRLLLSVIALVVILGAIYEVTQMHATTTTTSTSTIAQTTFTNINGCTTIDKPGTYMLASGFNTTQTSGACIKVTASNVKLIGNQHYITGSGPYSGTPPYSYGIELENASNVSVSSFVLSKFSYDIFLNNTSNSNITANNVSKPTLAGIWLYNSGNNTIQRNIVTQSQSRQGGIYLQSGNRNRIANNTISNNVYYGIVINSTNNNLSGDVFAGNPADLVCNATSAFKYSNQFGSSSCSINNYCEFATCKSNIPFNLSAVRLLPGPVNSCGAITSPGNYTLSRSLSAGMYINESNPLASNAACIKVLSPNARLNCRGNAISGSAVGVYVGPSYNASVSNCVFTNDTYGLYANQAFNPQIKNVTAKKSTYGVYLNNVSTGTASSITLLNNTYGLYVNASSGLLLDKITAHGNTYGIYSNSGASDTYSGGATTNNTRSDLYCSSSNYNSTTNLAQNVQCGQTDCNWASSTCKQTVPPVLASYPVFGCKTIGFPGNYSVKQNILAKGSCFAITASNVAFNCNGHIITASASGRAFVVANQTNVTISNCKMTLFTQGFNVSNSRKVVLSSIYINQTNQGLIFYNVSSSNVANVSVISPGMFGYSFAKLQSSTVSNNKVFGGTGASSGFIFSNSTLDTISLNTANATPAYGFEFLSSRNNNIYNNNAFSNANLDYYCSASNSGLFAEQGESVNYGLTKNKCNWLLEISPTVQPPSCAAIYTPTQINFNRDMLYTTGQTCYTVYVSQGAGTSGNNTIINCNNHVVYATHGGTFLKITNATNVKLENCIIRNFTTGVYTSALLSTITNNTFVHVGSPVSIANTRLETVSLNSVQNSTSGINATNAAYLNLFSNYFYNASTAISMTNINSSSVQNNTAQHSAAGIYLANSPENFFKDNVLLNMSSYGIYCSGLSALKSSANLDQGGNICSLDKSCAWMTSSTSCAPQ